jgi:hypothetical protein
MNRRRISRTELYELVWTRTFKDAGKALDVDPNHIGPACRLANIPLPPHGYWTKVHHHQAVSEAPPLPASEKSDVPLKVGYAARQLEKQRAAKARTELEINEFSLKTLLDGRRPEVLKQLDAAKREGLTANPNVNQFNERPLSEAGRRADEVVNGVVRLLQTHGFQITLGRLGFIEARKEGVTLSFRGRERAKQVKVKVQKSTPRTFLDSLQPDFKTELVPSGVAEFVASVRAERRWDETNEVLLTEQFPKIARSCLLLHSEEVRLDRLAEEKRREQEAVASASRDEEERGAEEEATWQRLLAVAAALEETERVRVLLSRLEAAIGVGQPDEDTLRAEVNKLRHLVIKRDPLASPLRVLLEEVSLGPSAGTGALDDE